MASDGGASFTYGPGVTLGGRGRAMSCTFHGCPGNCGVSLYPRMSSPADAGGAPFGFGRLAGGVCAQRAAATARKIISLILDLPDSGQCSTAAADAMWRTHSCVPRPHCGDARRTPPASTVPRRASTRVSMRHARVRAPREGVRHVGRRGLAWLFRDKSLHDSQLLLHVLQRDALGFRDRRSSTTKNCSTIMAEKNTNGAAAGRCGDHRESSSAISAVMNQCVKLPRLWPLARTRLGKTSLR